MKRTTSFFVAYGVLLLLVTPMLTLASHVTLGPHGHPNPAHAVVIGFFAGLIVRLVTRRFSP